MRRTAWLVGILSGVAAVGLLSSCGSDLATGAGTGSGGGTTATPEYLAVADQGNNRVLIYDAPFTTNESASVVLGQAGFGQATNTGSTPPGASTLALPSSVATDASGNLYVADEGACRVLQFQPPFTTGMNASVVFGQQSFSSPLGACYAGSSGTGTSGTNGLDGPTSIALDPHGDLWVVDELAGRVTEYVPPFSNGMAASVAIGQTTVSGIVAPGGEECNGAAEGMAPNPLPTASIFCQPTGIVFDAAGDLWVADWLNTRILEFVPPFSTGMAASLEIGQPAADAFTSLGIACDYGSATWFSLSCVTPTSLAFDASGTLWAVDGYHNRVLGFSPPFSNGMAATVEIGQPTLAQANAVTPPAANTLSFFLLSNIFGGGLWFNQDGDMFISDSVNSRVLVFDPPFTTGMSATTVIGQPNMTTGTPDPPAINGCSLPSATTLCYPENIVVF